VLVKTQDFGLAVHVDVVGQTVSLGWDIRLRTVLGLDMSGLLGRTQGCGSRVACFAHVVIAPGTLTLILLCVDVFP